MATIYTGVEASWYMPGIYVNVDLGRGTPSAGAAARRVLIIGNMLDVVESTIDDTSSFNGVNLNTSASPGEFASFFETIDDAGNYGVLKKPGDFCMVPDIRTAARYFGFGSELYTMAKAAFDAHPFVELWAYVQPEPDSGSAAATDPVTVSTIDSQDDKQDTADGVITITLMGQTCSVRVRAGHDAWQVAKNIAASFNSQFRDLPYYCDLGESSSSSSSSATDNIYEQNIVFRAKQEGSLWNDAEIKIDLGNTGVLLDGGTGTDGVATYKPVNGVGINNLTIDSASGADGAFAPNSVLYTERFHYVVIPYNDGTEGNENVKALRVFLANQADPQIGFRQQGIFAVSEKGTGVTWPNVRLDLVEPRLQCVFAPGSWTTDGNYTPGQLAAAMAATRAKHESADPAVNLCLRDVPGVPMTLDKNMYTRTDMNGAIADGVTMLAPFQGRMVIIRSVTTSANDDRCRVFDTGKVTVSDYVADDIEVKMSTRYKGFKLSPDTDMPLPSRVTTPSLIQISLVEWLRALEAQGLVVRVGELADQIRVEIDEDVPGRVNFEIPEDVIDILAVGAGNVIQVG